MAILAAPYVLQDPRQLGELRHALSALQELFLLLLGQIIAAVVITGAAAQLMAALSATCVSHRKNG